MSKVNWTEEKRALIIRKVIEGIDNGGSYEDIDNGQEIADRISPLLLALKDAKEIEWACQ